MRPFNDREKNIIKLISEINIGTTETFSKLLQDKYFTKDKGRILIIDHVRKNVLLYLSEKEFATLNNRTEAIGELCELMSLIEYLNEVRYLSVLKISDTSKINFMYSGFSEVKTTPTQISFLEDDGTTSIIEPDKIIKSDGTVSFRSIAISPLYESIQNYILGVVYPSEGIKSLVRNKFMSDEDIKFKKANRISWFAIIIALVIGILSFSYSIYSSESSSNSIEDQTKILKKIIISQITHNTNEINILEEILVKIDSLSASNRSYFLNNRLIQVKH